MSTSIVDVLQQTVKALDQAPAEKKVTLVETVGKLVQRIAADIVQINERNNSFLDNKLPALNAQLDAADKRTEKAANQILTCCERMMPLLKDCPAPAKAELQKYINLIFAAGNFQDLVSQHINEVRKIVQDQGEDAADIKAIMSSSASDDAFSHQARARLREKQVRSDAHLLNGPPTDVD
jgi:chemotaxis regulatin CheY-phosphate phosphatase CheZ